jgi:FtsP/CotA-like multicopper oxidase with cupredoxin domain
MDTPTVNGQAYPSMEVQPRTYRFRILNAANDRTQNLSLFQAVDAANNLCDAASTPTVAAPMEAGGAPLAACTEVRMVPAVPTAGFPANWPTDGRAGGVPDPLTAGPDMVQIGSEGGLLPAPAIHKAQPVTFDLDKRSITILNVLDHGVLLGGAERADVLIDFSKYAGKTLILYNDAPTPMPAVDPRTDYFTGMGDLTDAGGAYDPLAGYGPNTRTIMQIKVANVAPAAALDLNQLARDLPVAYAQTQPAPHVAQKIYDAPFNTTSKDNYAQIFTGGLTQPYFQMQGKPFAVTGATVVNGGSGYTATPLVTFTPPPAPGVAATATAVVQNGVVTGFTGFNPGSGYDNKTPLTVTIAPPGNRGTTATAKIEVNAFKVINKAIQELFDPIYGRMNATLAVELPFTSQTNATTIPLAYIDTPVESLDAISDGETQIWKITHNGVDSHPIHFHLMNVQLINRVDWAGVIKPPKAGEMGWKETITMSPLEDVYVAAKAIRPAAPFGLPTSKRLLDPSQAMGSKVMFTNLDPVTGQTPTFQRQLVNGINQNVPTADYSNQMTDFDNEYVWHCHILGHEENDFMRPMIFHPTVIVPDAPVVTSQPGAPLVTWNDPTPFEGWDKDGIPTAGAFAKSKDVNGVLSAPYAVEPTNNPKNEIGFQVTRTLSKTVTTTTPAVDPAAAPTVTTASTNTFTVAMVPANAESWLDTEVVPTNTTDTVYSVSYAVVAYNSLGNSVAGMSVGQTAVAGYVAPTSNVPLPGAPAAPTGLTQTFTPAVGATPATTTLSWDAVAGATGYTVSVPCTMVTTTSCTITGAVGQTVTVAAVVGTTTGAAASTFNGGAYAPVGLTSSNGAAGSLQRGSITLTWANNPLNVNNVTGLTLTWSLKGSNLVSTQTFAPSSTGVTLVGLSRDKDYNISLLANGVVGNSPAVNRMVLSAP